jgi:hypothetical protein
MKKINFALAAITTLLLAVNVASAAGDGIAKTREQVLAELVEAKRTGDMPAGSFFSGKKLNEVYPNQYPPVAKAPGKTREQVLAKLEEAKRTGDMPACGFCNGKKLN